VQKRNKGGIIKQKEKLMSTHCALGVKMKDGSISGCYVHYDGYEEHMLPAIKAFVEDNTTTALYILISKAAEVGGIRSFHSPGPYSEPKTDFLDDNTPYRITKENWNEDHMGTFAWYLVDYMTGDVEMRNSHG
tara:strand:+ start:532 stop:930 length:399 start_codon:yes stop_codon:yes gene_type:complete